MASWKRKEVADELRAVVEWLITEMVHQWMLQGAEVVAQWEPEAEVVAQWEQGAEVVTQWEQRAQWEQGAEVVPP